jgi:hypothetical protein
VNATIKHVLDQIALKHATPETYFTDARRDLQEAREFVRAKDLLTLPARDNLQVIETPEFMRGIYSVGGFSSLLRSSRSLERSTGSLRFRPRGRRNGLNRSCASTICTA